MHSLRHYLMVTNSIFLNIMVCVLCLNELYFWFEFEWIIFNLVCVFIFILNCLCLPIYLMSLLCLVVACSLGRASQWKPLLAFGSSWSCLLLLVSCYSMLFSPIHLQSLLSIIPWNFECKPCFFCFFFVSWCWYWFRDLSLFRGES
jgi:hypothetical protein